MYKGFNEKVKQEIIVLSDLKNLNYQTFRVAMILGVWHAQN